MSLDVSKRWRARMVVCGLVVAFACAVTLAQGPAPLPAGRGGRGGLPGATPEQTQAVAVMNAALADQIGAVNAARTELTKATFATANAAANIAGAAEKLRAAELTLALKRAEEFAKLQSGPNRLNPEQVAALVAAGGALPGGGRGN